MISTKIIQSGLEDLKKITKADFHLCDMDAQIIASTFDKVSVDESLVKDFAASSADSQNVSGYNYLKLVKDEDNVYVLVVYAGGADGYMYARIAASEIYHLMAIDNGRMDREDFYREMLHGSIMPGEIIKRADKMKIPVKADRQVYVINVDEDYCESARELLHNIFSDNTLNQVIVTKDNEIVLIKALDDGDDIYEVAEQVVAMINMELMIRARVTYGQMSAELKELSEGYKEADMAMEVASIFYDERDIASYTSLGIGRLIHQLPIGLCEMYLEEVLGDRLDGEADNEELVIIDKFFQNNLNVSETARALGYHRTTFIYKLDKLQKKTGLDIRHFEDAMTLKIAMMVAKYLEFKRE